MHPTPIEHRFPDAEAAATALADALAERIGAAVAARGVALIALSGGKSPIAVFRALRDRALPWDKVIVTQVDERWVPVDHPESNALLIREHLLTGPAAAARFVPMKNDAADPATGQPACEATLAALPRPFDVVVLGMGSDGHTASLFPNAPELAQALTTGSLCVAVTPPVAPHPRMSLSLTGLLDAQVLILQIGAEKLEMYRRVRGTGPTEELPVRAVFRQDRVPVEVWIGG